MKKGLGGSGLNVSVICLMERAVVHEAHHTLLCALAQDLSNPTSRYAIIKLFRNPIMPACLHKVPRHVGHHQVEMFTCIPKLPSYLSQPCNDDHRMMVYSTSRTKHLRARRLKSRIHVP